MTFNEKSHMTYGWRRVEPPPLLCFRVIISLRSYQMTMATIFRTASFKLWQKLTSALPLGPILPSIIPGVMETDNNKCT